MSTFLLNTHYRNTYQEGSKLLQTEHFENRELSEYLYTTSLHMPDSSIRY